MAVSSRTTSSCIYFLTGISMSRVLAESPFRLLCIISHSQSPMQIIVVLYGKGMRLCTMFVCCFCNQVHEGKISDAVLFCIVGS
jgi:hypothetical protein